MKCYKCGGEMAYANQKTTKTVQFLTGKRDVTVQAWMCLDCGKRRNEEHEDVPHGYSVGWDVIEAVINLRKTGMKTRAVSQALYDKYGIAIACSSLDRYFQTFGKGTL